MLVSHLSPNMLNQIGLKPLIDVLITQNLCDMHKLFLRRYSWLCINQLTLKISVLDIDDVIKDGNGAGLDEYCKTRSKSISLIVLHTRKYLWAWMSLQIQTRSISRYPWISMCLYTMYTSWYPARCGGYQRWFLVWKKWHQQSLEIMLNWI
jgi:hypothetical protein